MRLLAVIEAYSITGPAKNLLEFALLGPNERVETTIATFTRGAESNLFVERARSQQTPVHLVRERGLYDPATILRLREIAAEVRPDLIQTHAVKSHFLARLAGLPRKVPWVAFHHGYTWPTRKAALYNELDRWSLRGAAKVLTVSLPFRDELTARGVARERIEVVHNAIRPDWGTGAPAERATWRIPEGRPIVLIVGRLSKEKDHRMLLDAAGRLPAERKPHVLIVGEGPERPAIEAAVRDRGMEGWVTLTGQQPSAESFYGISAAAVLCSLSEGSPNALLEAMAAGVPVVATRVGGVPEIVVHEESALLIEPGDTEGLTRSLDRVLTDRMLAEKLIQAARNRVREHHTPQARVARLASIYRDVAGARC